jgi:hypothetical protein
MSGQVSGEATTYHALRDDEDGTVLALFRLRREADGLYLEAYRPGRGWVADQRAADVFHNGQDYELLDEAEAARLAAGMEAR